MNNYIMVIYFQSAIGEGMTRRDHSDVSNQVPSWAFECSD